MLLGTFNVQSFEFESAQPLTNTTLPQKPMHSKEMQRENDKLQKWRTTITSELKWQETHLSNLNSNYDLFIYRQVWFDCYNVC